MSYGIGRFEGDEGSGGVMRREGLVDEATKQVENPRTREAVAVDPASQGAVSAVRAAEGTGEHEPMPGVFGVVSNLRA